MHPELLCRQSLSVDFLRAAREGDLPGLQAPPYSHFHIIFGGALRVLTASKKVALAVGVQVAEWVDDNGCDAVTLAAQVCDDEPCLIGWKFGIWFPAP